MADSKSEDNLVFDYRALRLVVGSIALSFSFVVALLAKKITASISSSYHTDARDVFVGFLFVLGILLIAYKGHSHEITESNQGKFWKAIREFWARYQEDLVSTVGGAAAIAAAIFPTVCDDLVECTRDLKSDIHTVAAIILFSVVVYYCLVAFLHSAFSKSEQGKNAEYNFLSIAKYALQKDKTKADKKKKLRIRIYLFCGLGIAAVMLGLITAQLTMIEGSSLPSHLTFVAETVALLLFGIAWITASQREFLLDEDEKAQLKRKKSVPQEMA